MTYRIGDVDIQGSEPSNVIHAVFGRKTTDGGKARILRDRNRLDAKSLGLTAPDGFKFRDDLTMGHADPEDTRPSELA